MPNISSDECLLRANHIFGSGDVIIEISKNYGGSQKDSIAGAVPTPDGGFIGYGSSQSSDNDLNQNYGDYDYWVFRVDAAGEIIWSRNYGGSLHESAFDLVLKDDGNIVVLGRTYSDDVDVSNHYGESDVWIIELDPSGNLINDRNFGGTNFDDGMRIDIDIDGNYVFIGSTSSEDLDLEDNSILFQICG